MKKKKVIEYTINLPSGVQAENDQSGIRLKGPKGELHRKLVSPTLSIKAEAGKIVVKALKSAQRDKTMAGTFASHIRNLVRGVTEGHVYELKVCAGHFPMNVSVSGSQFIVKNFIGEKVPRIMQIPEGVSITVSGTKVEVKGVDKDLVSQAAANLEKLTSRTGFDKRIFQDGIYITLKDGKKVMR